MALNKYINLPDFGPYALKDVVRQNESRCFVEPPITLKQADVPYYHKPAAEPPATLLEEQAPVSIDPLMMTIYTGTITVCKTRPSAPRMDHETWQKRQDKIGRHLEKEIERMILKSTKPYEITQKSASRPYLNGPPFVA